MHLRPLLINTDPTVPLREWLVFGLMVLLVVGLPACTTPPQPLPQVEYAAKQ